MVRCGSFKLRLSLKISAMLNDSDPAVEEVEGILSVRLLSVVASRSPGCFSRFPLSNLETKAVKPSI